MAAQQRVITLSWARIVLVVALLVIGSQVLLALRSARQGFSALLAAEIAPGDSSMNPVLVLFFQPNDCGALRGTIEILGRNLWHVDGDTVAVLGLVLSAKEEDMVTVQAAANFTFPLHAARRSTAMIRRLHSLGYQETPLITALDGKGRVRSILPAQVADSARIAVLVSLLGSEGPRPVSP